MLSLEQRKIHVEFLKTLTFPKPELLNQIERMEKEIAEEEPGAKKIKDKGLLDAKED